MERVPVSAHALSILIVDDSTDTADSTAAVLACHGFTATAVYGGEAALLAATADPPDLVLLDICMPRLDGLELARRLRAKSAGKRLILVAVTGYAMDADHQASAAAGFDLHLDKPMDPAALIRVLEEYDRTAAELRLASVHGQGATNLRQSKARAELDPTNAEVADVALSGNLPAMGAAPHLAQWNPTGDQRPWPARKGSVPA